MGEMKQSLFGIFYSRFCLYKNATHTENVYLLDIANGAMWYLTAFFVTCLLFYLIADKCLASAKTMAVTSVVLVAVTMALNELPILLPWSMDIVPVAALLMLVGAWMRRYEFFERKESTVDFCDTGSLCGNGCIQRQIKYVHPRVWTV